MYDMVSLKNSLSLQLSSAEQDIDSAAKEERRLRESLAANRASKDEKDQVVTECEIAVADARKEIQK